MFVAGNNRQPHFSKSHRDDIQGIQPFLKISHKILTESRVYGCIFYCLFAAKELQELRISKNSPK
jgi:hypothetical protein